MSTDPIIVIENAHKCYGEVVAVDALDLKIMRGSFFGLLGRNGSGKTTTLHMLSTLAHADRGRIWVDGHAASTAPLAVRRSIGLVFQETALDRTLTVDENLHFAAALYGLPRAVAKARVDELLGLFDLQPQKTTRVAGLSGGMRRAVDIARGVLHHPKILLLDEPTIGLDLINRRAIWRFLASLRHELGMTIVVTTHYLEEAEACDQVVFMAKGRIIGQGAPDDLTRALGIYVLEIESVEHEKHVRLLAPRLGVPLIEGDRLLFRIASRDFPVAALQDELQSGVRSLQFKRPDLNDVYLWLNSPASPYRSEA